MSLTHLNFSLPPIGFENELPTPRLHFEIGIMDSVPLIISVLEDSLRLLFSLGLFQGHKARIKE
jgi:hypothetical protein